MRSWRVLILGGSSEASALAQAIAGRRDIDAMLSLAGRTVTPRDLPMPSRTGGFGGIAGLAAYLRSHRIDTMVDATHPFAAQMSRHARTAAAQTGVPLIRFTRPAWRPDDGDRWHEVADFAAAVAALGAVRRTVFLTVGRLHLAAFAQAPQHDYVIRSIDPVAADLALPRACFIEARGPFTVEDEARLMRDHAVDVLVTKNSGGAASAAKIEAARHLGLPVILVRRPADSGPTVATVATVADVLTAIEAHRTPPAPRGV